MIRLDKVNKYYNRHRKNQIHVINNTSLELGDSGLVAFLGESGCGKTTLLNAIGGLNRISSGNIYINNKKLPRRNGYFKDKIRTLNIGYIFQDYNLLNNWTVYDNIALSLKMIGITNKNEIKKRVDYVLEKTGMYRYRYRLAGALSGGQRQRVGIARALVKNPEVIIADEPTGNLDSKNTIEVMNIIKSISKEKLVILVTHEKDIAKFYASRIISLEDGKVIDDIENNHEDELDYRMDNKIYLKDFEYKDEIKNTNYNINLYSNENSKLDLNIVVTNGNIYIESKDNHKIEIIDEDSNLELVNDSYRKINKQDIEETTFSLDYLDNSKERIRYRSIYNIFTMLKVGFNTVLNYSIIKKILLFGFFFSTMFILYSVSNIYGVTRISDKDFITQSRTHIYVSDKSTLDRYNYFKNKKEVNYIIPGKSIVSLNLQIQDVYQFQNANPELSGSLTSINRLKESDLIAGRIPQASNEIVIDKLVIDRTNQGAIPLQLVGINKPTELIGKKLKVGDLSLTIVGVAKKAEPSLYVTEDAFIDILKSREEVEDSIKYVDYSKTSIDLKQGNLPYNDYEVLVNIDQKESMPINKEIKDKINNHKLKVVGYYFDPLGRNIYYVNPNMILQRVLSKNKGYTISVDNKEEVINILQQEKINTRDNYQIDRETYIKENNNSVRNSIIIAGILLAISFVEIFLMIRASFLSRIKEVGILRAIGIRKLDIYKMFLGEILVITTLTSIPAIMLMSAILKEISKISFIGKQFIVNKEVVIISFIIVYTLNIIIGLLPIRNLIRKEPADILARTDID